MLRALNLHIHRPDLTIVSRPEKETDMSAILFLFMGICFATSFFILACLGALFGLAPVRND